MELNIKNLKKRPPADLTCLDFGKSGLKVVRLKNSKGTLSLVGADILPPVDISDADQCNPNGLKLPKELVSNYAPTCVSNSRAVAKLLNLPQELDTAAAESQIKEQFGVDDKYRISTVSLSTAKSKSGAKVLAVALPERQIANLLAMTSKGPPALLSCEISCLSALTTFMNSRPPKAETGTCFIEMGARTTHIFFVHRDRLLLLRKYDVGGESLLEKIISDFHVDKATAANIMAEGAIDLSALYTEKLGFIARQATISRDFVERQENCSIQGIYLSGGLAHSKVWQELLEDKSGMGVHLVDPLQQMEVPEDVVSKDILAQSSRLTAAIGAGLGVFGKQ